MHIRIISTHQRTHTEPNGAACTAKVAKPREWKLRQARSGPAEKAGAKAPEPHRGDKLKEGGKGKNGGAEMAINGIKAAFLEAEGKGAFHQQVKKIEFRDSSGNLLGRWWARTSAEAANMIRIFRAAPRHLSCETQD